MNEKPERILMSSPDYFQIEYEINPWMRVKDQVKVSLALRQWENLREVYADHLKAKVILISPQKGVPELTFVGDSVFVYGSKAIASNFVYGRRQKEEKFVSHWFRKNNYNVKRLPDGVFFEGSADAFIWNGKILGGWGIRSDKGAYNVISGFLNLEAITLDLVNPKFYHLDTAFFPIDNNLIAHYPPAFSSESQSKIKDLGAELIRVDRDEAHNFVCNSVSIKDTIIMPKNCPIFRKEAQRRGYKTIEADVSEFIKAGGGIKCLTLKYTDRH